MAGWMDAIKRASKKVRQTGQQQQRQRGQKQYKAVNKYRAPVKQYKSYSPPRRSYTPPAPKRANYSPPRSTTGRIGATSGGSSGRSYGGSGGGAITGGGSMAPTAPAPKPVEPPKPPSLEDFLAGDTTWMSQEDALKKALADYQAQMERQKSQYNTEYDTNLSNLGVSRESALGDLENDYAGRGLLNSGLYANSTSELMSDYDARQAALESGRSSFLADLLAQFGDFKSEQDLTRTSARQDAINRRAAQYGL